MARRRLAVSALTALVALAGPSRAQEAGAPDRAFTAFDPADDDPTALARIAAEAVRDGSLPEFRGWLDSLRLAGAAGPHALAYWGALSLRARTAPDTVAVAFARHLEAHPGDPGALEAFVRVLEANAATDAAAWLRRAVDPGLPGAIEGPGGRAAGAWISALEEARRSGDPEEVRRALARALAADVPAARLAVVRGDLHLTQGAPDSAVATWAAAVGAAPRRDALAALGRVRLVQALQRARRDAEFLSALGRTLLTAPADPVSAAARLDSLAAALQGNEAPRADDSTGVARALLAGLAGERLGEAGEPAEASRALEAAAAGAGAEGAALLLAAGRWALAAGEGERAGELWREVVRRHPGTPDELEARRLLAGAEPGGGR